MTVYIANDHGGVLLKQAIVAHLTAKGVEVVNEGSDIPDIVRYPRYAAKVAGRISRDREGFGILICNTGVGMSIAANKFAGVRAALVTSPEIARWTRMHNDSNVLCLGARFLETQAALDIVDAFLSTPFEGGRHAISLELISMSERVNLTGDCFECPEEDPAPTLYKPYQE